MIKQSSSTKKLLSLKATCYKIMDECLKNPADEIPEWLDMLLADMSLDVAMLREEEKHESH